MVKFWPFVEAFNYRKLQGGPLFFGIFIENNLFNVRCWPVGPICPKLLGKIWART